MYFLMAFMGEILDQEEDREKIGYALLIVTAFYFLINLVPVLVNMVIFCKRSVKRKLMLRKVKKERARIKT